MFCVSGLGFRAWGLGFGGLNRKPETLNTNYREGGGVCRDRVEAGIVFSDVDLVPVQPHVRFVYVSGFRV